MRLPDPQYEGDVSLERAIRGRRTIRSFDGKALSLRQVSQLLWSAQGITEPGGFKRAAPSAGALYPMDIYAVVGAGCVEGLDPGIYHYEPEDHSISQGRGEDVRGDVARASLRQTWMAQAPLNLVITAEYSRITGKYGQRGIRYAMIEAGLMRWGWPRGSWEPLMMKRSFGLWELRRRTNRSWSCPWDTRSNLFSEIFIRLWQTISNVGGRK
jgi:nitroreductase